MLYSLGYPIPSTKNIRFEACEVESIIECHLGKVVLQRYSSYLIDMIVNGETKSYILPSDQNRVLSLLFNTENINILNNLLGAFYLDQEKGWTLLNRGKVIGSISFSILDSPSGKEVDTDNINLMINILKRDFSDHQIIIASIYEYNLDSVNRIEIINKLIE